MLRIVGQLTVTVWFGRACTLTRVSAYPQLDYRGQRGTSFPASAPPVLSSLCLGRGRDRRQYTHRREVVHAAANVWKKREGGRMAIGHRTSSSSPPARTPPWPVTGATAVFQRGRTYQCPRPCIPDEWGAGSSLATTLIRQENRAGPPAWSKQASWRGGRTLPLTMNPPTPGYKAPEGI